MQRTTETDAELDVKLEQRKKLAEARMGKHDAGLNEIHSAAYYWYGSYTFDACCLAENRLARGETYGETT